MNDNQEDGTKQQEQIKVSVETDRSVERAAPEIDVVEADKKKLFAKAKEVGQEELKRAQEERKKAVEAESTRREEKALNANRYDQIKDGLPNEYILRHKRTGKIIQVRGTSAFHAAGLAGWRPRHAIVLSSARVGGEAEEQPVVGSISATPVSENAPASIM